MATYKYIAFDQDGKKKKGFITAENERSARLELKKINLKPFTLNLSNKENFHNIKVKEKDSIFLFAVR